MYWKLKQLHAFWLDSTIYSNKIPWENPFLLITPYWPDIVIYNGINNFVVLIELTCNLDSIHNIESARDHKQGKKEYQQILIIWEFSVLHYNWNKCLRHYPSLSFSVFQNHFNFIQNETITTKYNCWRICMQFGSSINFIVKENIYSKGLSGVVTWTLLLLCMYF